MKHAILFGKFQKLFFLIIATLIFHSLSIAQTQTLTARPNRTEFGIGIGGFYESLPIDYATSPSRKYPLLIALHGSGERGSGSSTDLPDLLSGGGVPIPEIINSGNFPDSFTVNDETFSFIVICPQLSNTTDSLLISIKRLIAYCKTNYRVDPSRIYMTGFSFGSQMQYNFMSQADEMSGSTVLYRYADSLAAIASVATYLYPSSAYSAASPNIARLATSNLPVFAKHNRNDPSSAQYYFSTSLVNNLNGKNPAPSPLARYTLFYPGNTHDAWTTSYDPAYAFDSITGLNMYEWMLQYTNKKLDAKAGKDTAITFPADSVILNGSKSTVRQGRIDSLRWSKVSGPSNFSITSPTSFITSVTGLVAGTYEFELKLYHTDGSTIRTDTVSVIVNPDTTIIPPVVQVQTKVIQNISSNIKGYLQSLPVSYNTDSTKRFPLIISLHGDDGAGSGDSTALDTVAMQGIPKLIRDGQFPSNVTVNGQSYSFIVISPQFNSTTPSNPHTQINALINYLKSNLRVDAERIYVAGLGTGGGLGYTFAVGGTTTTNVGFVDSIAALVGAGSNVPSMNTARWDRLVQSNLPHWLTHNNGDPVIPSSRSTSAVSGYNGKTPTPAPSAQLTLFSSASQDSWTTTYDPNYILDSTNSYNVYQWMLQYTNKDLAAKAGKDQSISISTSTLDGSKSMARRGRIASYAWTKISGGSVTITSDTSVVANVSGLSTGTYQFQLQVKHTDSTTAKDTVTITVSGVSPRVAAPVVEVAQPAMQTDELLSAKINPTVAQSQVTVVITGKATGKANLQISSMDGKRLQRQSFVKDGTTTTRTVNVSSMPAGTYIVEIIVGGKHRKILRFVKQ